MRLELTRVGLLVELANHYTKKYEAMCCKLRIVFLSILTRKDAISVGCQ